MGTVVELEYSIDTGLCMYVFLPGEDITASRVETQIMNESVLTGSQLNFSMSTVRLEMPRVEVRQNMELVPILDRLGLPRAGHFGRMTNEGLVVGDVLHQVYLRADEEGSEATAATAVFMSRMLFIPETTLRVDRT